MAKTKEIKVTLVKSRFGRLKSHKDCVRGLGLRKIHQTVTVADSDVRAVYQYLISEGEA